MTWLDLGNGWRNLFLLSCLLQAAALGLLFATRKQWMREHRVAAFLTGVAATPLVQYLWMLLLALLWPAAPRLVYIGILPLLATGYLCGLLFRVRRRILALLKGGLAAVRKLRIDRAAAVSASLALAMLLLLAPICVRFATSTISAQADSAEFMGLALRYTEDRDTGALFTKADTQTDYRGTAHFPSLELYMAYGLMHNAGVAGYPYDKPMFTAIGMLVFYLLAAFVALCLRVLRGKLRWLMPALLLLNLVPNLVFSVASAPRDTWRCLALVLAALALIDLRPGKGRRYIPSLLLSFFVCFTVMSAHVVCFVVLPFLVAAWAIAVFAEAVLRKQKPLPAFFKTLGVALGGAAGVLLGFSGNLWCYRTWGELSPFRVLNTFTGAPWFDTYMRMEYRLEETTTSLNFWQAKYDIVMAYATPVGIWGMRLALCALLCGCVYLVWRRGKRRTALAQAAPDLTLPMIALITLFTLAPMTGLLDTRFYSFSGTFLKLQRYTLQWYLFACVMIAAAGAYLEDRWPSIQAILQKRFKRQSCPLWAKRIPALACVLLCVFWFIEGVKETGYSASFYRYGRPMLTNELYAQDNYIQSRYGTLMRFHALMGDGQNLLISRESYQYPIHSRALLLTANPIAPLLNLSLAEIPAALARLKVAAVATEPDFWDERFFAESTLNAYLRTLPAEQVIEEGGMRIYVLDAGLAAAYRAAYPALAAAAN